MLTHHKTRKTLGIATAASLGVWAVLLIAGAYQHSGQIDLHARLLPGHLRGETPWKTITAEQIASPSGVTLPANTHIIFTMPSDGFNRIYRRTLFGRSDDRYWGYCFPRTKQEERVLKRRGFPGLIFLSEKEREVMREDALQRNRQHIRRRPGLNQDKLNEVDPDRGTIRHQKEVFKPGDTCYMMSSVQRPMGLNPDNDGLNNREEKDNKTDPDIADTDGDGVPDGLEVQAFMNPISRDTDGDGLLDGIEDANQNGKKDNGESDPLKRDSDNDTICDGLCLYEDILVGEDRNLNGVLDEGETSPISIDTDGDGILDSQEVYCNELELC